MSSPLLTSGKMIGSIQLPAAINPQFFFGPRGKDAARNKRVVTYIRPALRKSFSKWG